MVLTVDATNRISEREALRAMFEARKRVFIDLLKWDLPALDNRFEIDQFDDEHAYYLILLDPERRHLASARLLPTTRPGILDTLFADLCDEPLPAGPDVFEITRFCLSRDLRAADRRTARNRLVTALARFALANGITTYTGVAETGWYDQIVQFGWDCRPLGPPRRAECGMLRGLRIHVDGDTLDRLADRGILTETRALDALDRAA